MAAPIEAPAVVRTVLRTGGQPLDAAARAFMEPRFGHDFSRVRVQTGAAAAAAAGAIDALAYTVGDTIVFGAGRYDPATRAGRRLLAHELAHVIQQGSGSARVQRAPNPDPPPEPFVEGRPAHPHPALGNWNAVQANAARECQDGSGDRRTAECFCAALSPGLVLSAAKVFVMHGKPRAVAHLDHYRSGGGADFDDNANLDALMKEDLGARAVVADGIAKADRGHVFIRQTDYSIEDFQLAFGGIDRVDYKVNRAAGTVDVWFKDRYDFHPAGFGHTNMGVGDFAPPGRESNCAHLAAVEEKANGAADYWMFGHATLPISLFTPIRAPTPAPAPGVSPASPPPPGAPAKP